MNSLTESKMLAAFSKLDGLIPRPVSLLVGGGGAMILAYKFPLSTMDIDAIPKGMSIDELKPAIEAIAKELDLPVDWLNPWFGSFTQVLRPDYEKFVVSVFQGERLKVAALSKEDLLIMKCFARRQKDIPHARVLVRSGADVSEAEKRIEALKKIKIPGADRAMEFLDEIIDMESS